MARSQDLLFIFHRKLIQTFLTTIIIFYKLTIFEQYFQSKKISFILFS